MKTLFDHRRARVRFALAAAAGAVAFACAQALGESRGLRVLLAWDAFAATACALSLLIVLRSDARETKRRASAEDPGRAWTSALVLGGSVVALFAAVTQLRAARTSAHPVAWGAVVVSAIVGSWLLTHLSYTFRYAHLYFAQREPPLAFPEDRAAPDDRDFAYFAFTIGMTFQTSDVAVKSAALRRAVLGHALVAFGYNTTILGLMVSLVASLVG